MKAKSPFINYSVKYNLSFKSFLSFRSILDFSLTQTFIETLEKNSLKLRKKSKIT